MADTKIQVIDAEERRQYEINESRIDQYVKDKTYYVEYTVSKPILPSLLQDASYTEKGDMYQCNGYLSVNDTAKFYKELQEMAFNAEIDTSFSVRTVSADDYLRVINFLSQDLQEKANDITTSEYKQAKAKIKEIESEFAEHFPNHLYVQLSKDTPLFDDKDVK